ncbi:MAG: hypothetical protein RugAbin2_01146 [Rugosibacter sp.]|nr:hypothetical protein [Rugosibacter sp.]
MNPPLPSSPRGEANPPLPSSPRGEANPPLLPSRQGFYPARCARYDTAYLPKPFTLIKTNQLKNKENYCE